MLTGTFFASSALLMLFLIAGGAVGSVRLLGEESSQGKGRLQLLDYDTWTPLCAGSLGPIEGQLACRELGFPLLQRLSAVELPAEEDSFFEISFLHCGARLDEGNASATLTITECYYHYSQCDSALYLECSTSTAAGTVIISVETNHSLPTTFISIISPEDNVYVDTCATHEHLNCSGIFHFQKPVPAIDDLITQLMSNRSCGYIDFNPCPPEATSAPTSSSTKCSAALFGTVLATSAGLTLFMMVAAAI